MQSAPTESLPDKGESAISEGKQQVGGEPMSPVATGQTGKQILDEAIARVNKAIKNPDEGEAVKRFTVTPNDSGQWKRWDVTDTKTGKLIRSDSDEKTANDAAQKLEQSTPQESARPTEQVKPKLTPELVKAAVLKNVPRNMREGGLIDTEKQSAEQPPIEHIGMGAAVPSEFENKPTTPTGIKNATVDAERVKRGLPAAIEPARRSFGKVWDEAMAKVDKDPDTQTALINELRKQPRAITDTEDALLLQRQIDLQNEYGKVTRELAQAYDDSKNAPNEEAAANQAAIAQELKLRVANLSDQLLDLYNINKRVGTETGRGLNARKMMAYEDYSLASMETRLRAAKDGKPLTTEENTKVKQAASNVERAQKAVDEYQKKVIAADSTDKISPALRALKTRYANRIEELKAKMAGNDFTPKSKTPLVLDQEAIRLKAAYENAKLQFDRMVMAERLKNRTLLQKTQDTFVKWRRAFLLSSPVTLAKLTSAAIERSVITPTEEAVGGVYSKLPVLNRVAALAPREGGLNVNAEAKALTEGFTKGMKDSWNTLRTGHSDMDSLFGKRDVMPREMIDFIGSVHGALKAPVKRAEFARSFEKRAAFAIRQGQDVSDPMIQSKIAIEAYKDANRSIFMQDNKLSAAWNAGVAILKTPDKTGKTPLGRRTLATGMQVMLPIVKVPTNIVAETLQYAFGSVTGSTRLAIAIGKGIETLKPEEADLIMRELKKGSLGSALLLAGYLAPQYFGGYYQENDRKAKGHPAFGTMKIGDVQVPSMLIHNPLLETLQIGATVRLVADSRLRVHDRETQGTVQGSIAGLLGLTDEVPFVRQTTDMLKVMNPYERDKYADQVARDLIVPLGVSWVAAHFDKNSQGQYVARDPKNLAQTIESAIPLLRKNVPENKQKTALQNK